VRDRSCSGGASKKKGSKTNLLPRRKDCGTWGGASKDGSWEKTQETVRPGRTSLLRRVIDRTDGSRAREGKREVLAGDERGEVKTVVTQAGSGGSKRRSPQSSLESFES